MRREEANRAASRMNASSDDLIIFHATVYINLEAS